MKNFLFQLVLALAFGAPAAAVILLIIACAVYPIVFDVVCCIVAVIIMIGVVRFCKKIEEVK